MRQVQRSAIVPYTAEAMFDLVADVEAYPQFLPACTGAAVHSRDGEEIVASIALSRGPLKTEFTTRNRLTRPGSIAMLLVDGPFSTLSGAWEFAPLGDGGSRVSLSLEFSFASQVTDLLLGPPFEALCNELIDAFVRRARSVYR